MAEEIFMYAVTTGFFIGLVAILFGTRFRRISKSVSISTSRSGGALGGTREHTHMFDTGRKMEHNMRFACCGLK
jgi:hypothetical protein